VNRNDDQSEATETYPFGQDWEGWKFPRKNKEVSRA
jgi:hypothetical protein